MRSTISHQVSLQYRRQELLALFTQAVREDVEKGGRYDARSEAINIWSQPWLPQSLRPTSTIMGTFHCAWGEANTIYQIDTEQGFSVHMLLQELCVLELKAFGRVKHGTCQSVRGPAACLPVTRWSRRGSDYSHRALRPLQFNALAPQRFLG